MWLLLSTPFIQFWRAGRLSRTGQGKTAQPSHNHLISTSQFAISLGSCGLGIPSQLPGRCSPVISLRCIAKNIHKRAIEIRAPETVCEPRQTGYRLGIKFMRNHKGCVNGADRNRACGLGHGNGRGRRSTSYQMMLGRDQPDYYAVPGSGKPSFTIILLPVSWLNIMYSPGESVANR